MYLIYVDTIWGWSLEATADLTLTKRQLVEAALYFLRDRQHVRVYRREPGEKEMEIVLDYDRGKKT